MSSPPRRNPLAPPELHRLRLVLFATLTANEPTPPLKVILKKVDIGLFREPPGVMTGGANHPNRTRHMAGT